MGKLLTVKEAAEKLSVSVSAIYKWVDEQRIQYVDLGDKGKRRCIRFKEDALESMITNNTRN